MAYGNEDDNFAFKPDSVQLVDASELKVDTLPQVAWRPDAIRAVWLGAIFPGLGQMYNRSWWKVPIVYGALMGCGYAIMTNQQSYTEYKTAYLDLYNDNANDAVTDDVTKSYNAIIVEYGWNIGVCQQVAKLAEHLSPIQGYIHCCDRGCVCSVAG